MSNPLLEFTRALWSGGEIVLCSSLEPDARDILASLAELRRLEAEYRHGLPGQPPTLHQAAAEWGLLSLYRAAQFLVYRELSEELLRSELTRKCPAEPAADVCYSVDLSFRFLPDILRLARAASANDPVVECLKVWAAEWPLSSVGIPDISAAPVDSFIADASLRALYVDRIIASGDQSRLSDGRVADAIRIALGGFRELAPAIYDVVHSSAPPDRLQSPMRSTGAEAPTAHSEELGADEPRGLDGAPAVNTE